MGGGKKAPLWRRLAIVAGDVCDPAVGKMKTCDIDSVCDGVLAARTVLIIVYIAAGEDPDMIDPLQVAMHLRGGRLLQQALIPNHRRRQGAGGRRPVAEGYRRMVQAHHIRIAASTVEALVREG
jgi:hypothetical protein